MIERIHLDINEILNEDGSPTVPQIIELLRF